MDLAIVHDNLVDEIQYGLFHVGTSAIGEMGYIYEDLSEQLEALALCHLLRFLDLTEFRKNLIRSGQARLHFLRRSRLEGNDRDRHLGLGRTKSFLDVIAAGDLGLARHIANESIRSWNPDWEYEDDFCFFHLLHRIVQIHPLNPPPDSLEILARFERSLEGKPSHRLAVCTALIMRSPTGFSQALEELLAEERAVVENLQDSAKVHEGDLAYWPTRFVSIEGLALLALANLLGLATTVDFDRCPQVARLPWTGAIEPNLFEMLEQAP